MTVYMLRADANHYENLILEREQDSDKLLDWFVGNPIGDSWRPISVKVLRDKDHKDRPASDFPSLGGRVPVFSKRAVEVLGDLLEANGELLPLDCPDGVYFALNVTRVIDALDSERSELKRFSSGEIMNIVRYELQPLKLAGASIFKLPQVARMYTYVTDEFVRRTKEAGLAGFDFRRVWSGPGP